VREQGGESTEVRVVAQAIRVLDVERAERMESERRTQKKGRR
jgi:ribosomal protein L28